jgi:hypothetical protein
MAKQWPCIGVMVIDVLSEIGLLVVELFGFLAIARAALAGEWIFFEADYFLKMLLI